ncbi:MAG: hypothetical protein ACTSPJ_10525 [Candidatus Heimdallarchaeaceae archaeon]
MELKNLHYLDISDSYLYSFSPAVKEWLKEFDEKATLYVYSRGKSA